MDPNSDFLFLRTGEYPIGYSCWSLWAGFLVTSLAMILWRPQSRVFLDRICISQTDVALKTQAIFSLAGLLKKSDSMLILWDPSWTERLWCLFELAAFLQSKKDLKKELIIRPTFLGPVHIAVFLTCVAGMIPLTMAPMDVNSGPTSLVVPSIFVCASGFAAFYVAMSTLRRYFRDLDIMKQQLLSISFDTARSSCCDTNHVGESGAPVFCDRRIVKECVNVWFGSEEAGWWMVVSNFCCFFENHFLPNDERMFSWDSLDPWSRKLLRTSCVQRSWPFWPMTWRSGFSALSRVLQCSCRWCGAWWTSQQVSGSCQQKSSGIDHLSPSCFMVWAFGWCSCPCWRMCSSWLESWHGGDRRVSALKSWRIFWAPALW